MDSKVTQGHKTYNDAIKTQHIENTKKDDKHGPKKKREKGGGMGSLNPGKFVKGRQFVSYKTTAVLLVVNLVTFLSLVKQKLLTRLKLLSSPLVFIGVRVVGSLVFCVVFCRSMVVLVLLAIALSVLLRFTDSDYPITPLVSSNSSCRGFRKVNQGRRNQFFKNFILYL